MIVRLEARLILDGTNLGKRLSPIRPAVDAIMVDDDRNKDRNLLLLTATGI